MTQLELKPRTSWLLTPWSIFYVGLLSTQNLFWNNMHLYLQNWFEKGWGIWSMDHQLWLHEAPGGCGPMFRCHYFRLGIPKVLPLKSHVKEASMGERLKQRGSGATFGSHTLETHSLDHTLPPLSACCSIFKTTVKG